MGWEQFPEDTPFAGCFAVYMDWCLRVGSTDEGGELRHKFAIPSSLGFTSLSLPPSAEPHNGIRRTSSALSPPYEVLETGITWISLFPHSNSSDERRRTSTDDRQLAKSNRSRYIRIVDTRIPSLWTNENPRGIEKSPSERKRQIPSSSSRLSKIERNPVTELQSRKLRLPLWQFPQLASL